MSGGLGADGEPLDSVEVICELHIWLLLISVLDFELQTKSLKITEPFLNFFTWTLVSLCWQPIL